MEWIMVGWMDYGGTWLVIMVACIGSWWGGVGP